MMTPYCDACGRPSIRTIGRLSFCSIHLAAIQQDAGTPSEYAHMGHGVRIGPPDDDQLQCSTCGATWHGPDGDWCEWCERSHRLMLEHQADIVLTPPDIDLDMHDDEIAVRMKAWADRLWRAVQADIVDKTQAERALALHVKKVA